MSGPEYDAVSLCFPDAGVEKAFLAARQEKSFDKIILGLGFFLLYLMGSLLMLALTDGVRLFSPSNEREYLNSLRSGMIIFLIGLTLGGVLVARSCRAKRPGCLEVILVCGACLVSVLIFVQHPGYLVKIAGISIDWGKHHESWRFDDKLLFYLNIWLTGCHLFLPVRWIRIWLLEVAIVFCYVIPALGLGSPEHKFSVAANVLLISFLAAMAASAKRASEIQDRLAFAQVAAERTLRAQAEHRLSRAQEPRQRGRDGPAQSESLSQATTTNTGDLFAISSEEAIESQLQRIMELGFQERWLIQPEALQPLHDQVLGAGSFGIAVVASFHGAEVALKVPRSSQDRTQVKVLLGVAEELRVLRRLRHPNIVTFYGSSVVPASSEIVLVMEYVRGLELCKAICGAPLKPHDVVDRCILADNVCSALAYLHGQRPIVVHGDIKSSNVMVEQLTERRNAKLLDFGLSRLLTRRTKVLGGTLAWMAPEVIRKESSGKAPSADVFSFGRLLYSIMTATQPLADLSRGEIINAACESVQLDLDWPRDMMLLEEARALCEACLDFDPAQRATIVAAQASLRRWGWSASLPGNVAMPLREAFPEHVGPGGDLQSAIQRARQQPQRRSSSARGVGPGGGSGGSSSARREHARQRRRQRGDTVPLIAPQFEETPQWSKLQSLALALSGWNVPQHATDCCAKHALVGQLRRTAVAMQTFACKPLTEQADWQCPACKTLIFEPSGASPGTCGVCGRTSGASASTDPRSGRLAAAQSLSEEAPDNEDGAAQAARAIASL